MMVFDTALQTGLRKDARNPRNTQALVECRGLLATQYGLKAFHEVYDPIDATRLSWMGLSKNIPPWPQLFRLNSMTLVAGWTKIFQVAEVLTYGGTEYYWVPIDYPVNNPALTGFTPGFPWHVADFYDRVFMFNGNCVAFQDYNAGGSLVWMYQDAVTVNTGCAHKEGRLFYGGFDSSDYYAASGWHTYLDSLLAHSNDVAQYIDFNAHGPGPNWVWWSMIGGGDALWMFPRGLDTTYGRTLARYGREGAALRESEGRPFWPEMAERNDSGMRPMPFRGKVQQMIPMGNNVIVYGEDGVAALVAASSPAPTYGLYTFPEIGTRLGSVGRMAAAGGDAGQLFIDEAGTAWFIHPDLRVEKLGYQEYFENPPSGLVVCYEPIHKEFWITDGADSYVLNETGLSHVTKEVWSVSDWLGEPVGITRDTASPNLVVVLTDIFDGGERGVWEVETVRLATTDTDYTGWYVAVDWRMDKGDAWTRTTPIHADGRGIARVNVVGIEFRVCLTHFDRTKADLERIEVELRQGERINMRRVI